VFADNFVNLLDTVVDFWVYCLEFKQVVFIMSSFLGGASVGKEAGYGFRIRIIEKVVVVVVVPTLEDS
jgi:hypothetical protein